MFRPVSALATLSLILTLQLYSCTAVPETDNSSLDQLAQQLVETDERVVRNCRNLGSVSRTADMTLFFAIHLTKQNIQAVKRQAAQLGATHIVWLYRYKDSAAAQAYACR